MIRIPGARATLTMAPERIPDPEHQTLNVWHDTNPGARVTLSMAPKRIPDPLALPGTRVTLSMAPERIPGPER